MLVFFLYMLLFSLLLKGMVYQDGIINLSLKYLFSVAKIINIYLYATVYVPMWHMASQTLGPRELKRE